MLTAQQLYYACLEYIGEYSLTLVEYTGNAATAVRRAGIRSLNEALDELFQLKPELFKREVGATVLASATGTVAVTADSVDVSDTSFTTGLHGNTVLIGGQAEYNAIRTEGSAKKLVIPYTGTTGTQSATQYGDVVLLDPTYSRPLGPVWLSDIRQLVPLADKSDLISYGYDRAFMASDWGRYPMGVSRSVMPRRVAQPEAFYVETHLLEAGTTEIRIFLAPLPDKVYSLRFDAGVRPLPVVTADIGTDDSADPNRQFAFPDQADAKFLLPIVLYHWSKKPFFNNAANRQMLYQAYKDVLPQIEAWTAQPQTGGRIDVGGWR